MTVIKNNQIDHSQIDRPGYAALRREGVDEGGAMGEPGALSVPVETECAPGFCVVAFYDGKPDSIFPENALGSVARGREVVA
jgi:hypothetical protein